MTIEFKASLFRLLEASTGIEVEGRDAVIVPDSERPLTIVCLHTGSDRIGFRDQEVEVSDGAVTAFSTDNEPTVISFTVVKPRPITAEDL